MQYRQYKIYNTRYYVQIYGSIRMMQFIVYIFVTENRLAVRCFSRSNVVGIRNLGTPVTVTSRFTKLADSRI